MKMKKRVKRKKKKDFFQIYLVVVQQMKNVI